MSEIQGYLRETQISYTPKYVKVHQDEVIDVDKIDTWALLNIKLNFWAKEFWAENRNRISISVIL